MSADSPHVRGVRCTARSKRTGQPCQQAPMQGRTVCYHHGGKSARGLASGTWKTGRFSKALPTALLPAYERSLSDGELIALRDELAAVDARLVQLFERLTTGDYAAAWDGLRTAWRAMEAAQAGQDTAEAAHQLRLIRDQIAAGPPTETIWAEVYDALDLRRRLADTERKRLEAMRATITAEEALALIGALAASVKRHVTDRAALAAITADLERVLPSGGARAAS